MNLKMCFAYAFFMLMLMLMLMLFTVYNFLFNFYDKCILFCFWVGSGFRLAGSVRFCLVGTVLGRIFV